MPNYRVQCPYCPSTLVHASAARTHVKAKHKDQPMPKTFEHVPLPDTTPKRIGRPKGSTNSPTVHTPTKQVQPNAHGGLPCPECTEVIPSSKGKPNYNLLGRHRRFRHNVIGDKWKGKKQQYRPRGPYKKRNLEEGIVHVPQTNTIFQIAATAPQLVQHDDITLAYAIAVGCIKEFCRHFAEEHDVPTKLFTRSVSELFLREARR